MNRKALCLIVEETTSDFKAIPLSYSVVYLFLWYSFKMADYLLLPLLVLDLSAQCFY